MSIKITGQKRYFTGSNALMTGQSRFSISFFYRFDGDPSVASNCFIFHRNYYVGPWGLMKYTGGGKSTVNFAFPLSSGARPTVEVDFTVGAVYHVALVFDQGIQLAYINAVPRTMGTVTEVTGAGAGSSVPFSIGGWQGTPNNAASFTVHNFEVAEGYALNQAGAAFIRDGLATLSDLATTATRRVRWTLSGNDGGVPVVNQAGLLDSFSGLPLVSTDGTGSASYIPAIDWSPAVSSTPYVAMSGEAIGCRYFNKANGLVTMPTSLATMPTIKKNGVSMGALRLPWIESYCDRTLFMLAAGESIAPGDVVTLTAPAGWMICDAGLTEALTDTLIDNRVGRSCFGTDAIERTLRVGVNVTPSDVSVMNCQYSRDMSKKVDNFANATRDSQGYPTFTPSATHMASIMFCPDDNPVDATGYPGPLGLHAIGWDEKNPSNQSNFDFCEQNGYQDYDANFKSVERVDLRNNGTLVGGKIVGKVRVFDIQKQPNAPKAQRLIRLRITSPPNKIPSYENFVIYGPKDFTYQDGVPVVLDRSNPWGATKVLLDRLKGSGSIRAAEATIENMGGSNMCEPEHLYNGNDYHWGWGRPQKVLIRVGVIQARPYSQVNAPYVYHHTTGSKYPVTLAAPIDATQTTLQIVYDEANHVFAHLRLFIDDEVIRIDSIASGTLATGNTVTFNVSRGMAFSSKASHAAGTIQAGYRFAFTAAGMASTQGGIMELVTDGPHKIWSGVNIAWLGTWPNFTFEGGEIANARQGGMVAWMTGPDRMCIGFGMQTAGLHNLSTTYNLDPVNCYTNLGVPNAGGSFWPYEALATTVGEIDGCDLFLHLASGGSDDLFIEVAKRVRDNLPPGRRVYLEVALEAWNWGFTGFAIFSTLNRMLTGSADHFPAITIRTGEAVAIFERVFGEHGRAGEIKSLINMNSMAVVQVTTVLDFAKSQNPPIRIDAIAFAPYLSMPSYAGDVSTVTIMNHCTAPQCIDLFTHCLLSNASFNTGSYPHAMRLQKERVDAYNAETGNNCEMVGYEGGLEVPIPLYKAGSGSISIVSGFPDVVGSGTSFLKLFFAGDTIAINNGSAYVSYTVSSVADNTHLTLTTNYASTTASGLAYRLMVSNQAAKAYDMALHPNWYIAEQDIYAMCQQGGYKRMNIFRYSGVNHYLYGVVVGYFQWPMYNWLYQDHGRGDGSDGKKDNRLTVCMPGSPHTKLPTQNVHEENVSVRGQAFLDWNAAALDPPPQPPPPPPPPTNKKCKRFVPSPSHRPFSLPRGS